MPDWRGRKELLEWWEGEGEGETGRFSLRTVGCFVLKL